MSLPGGPNLPDVWLVEAARSGSADAREALFRRHLRTTHRFASRLLGRDVDIADVVQDSMAEAIESFASLREPALFSSWLGRVVINTVRRTLRRRRMVRRLGITSTEPAAFEALASPGVDHDAAFELNVVRRALKRLPEKTRTALLLRRVESCSIPEIASQMNASRSTVKRWLDKAHLELERELARGERAL